MPPKFQRRRFLQVIAAAGFFTRPAQAAEWRGSAFGADVALTLSGPGAAATLLKLPAFLAQIEAVFSLYRPSELTALNTTGQARPSPWLAQALSLCNDLHNLTQGAFDPTVQPLWQALSEGENPVAKQSLVGWRHVQLGPKIQLSPGQALTLNGMAQGFAADLVRDWLAAQGFRHALVQMGEYAALGGPFTLGISDPVAGLLGQRHLASGRALAASSPRATLVGGQPHILHPQGFGPRWSTVAVEADSAALADGLSTALVFLDVAQITALRHKLPRLGPVTLIDDQGDLRVI
ncbi:MAG: FAD:protein FMN transferase [Gemmobacter sp.]|uniref:FAD:protein FMN transferase n=1 Tax=Gemmobacter sp. TaxID=1898957 RepID=UPI001A5C4596|nr:FAD:protein FMN transferase [Gemmobacter sp.]MBL8561205.1 FAD:protein FMN transferase [Gemmobacter sp.]